MHGGLILWESMFSDTFVAFYVHISRNIFFQFLIHLNIIWNFIDLEALRLYWLTSFKISDIINEKKQQAISYYFFNFFLSFKY